MCGFSNILPWMAYGAIVFIVVGFLVRREVKDMYEKRIKDLESRVSELEAKTKKR